MHMLNLKFVNGKPYAEYEGSAYKAAAGLLNLIEGLINQIEDREGTDEADAIGQTILVLMWKDMEKRPGFNKKRMLMYDELSDYRYWEEEKEQTEVFRRVQT